MPQPFFSNDDLDSLLDPTPRDGEVQYESLLDDDLEQNLDDDNAAGSQAGRQAQQPALDPSLTSYLTEDIRQRREEAQRRADEQRRNAAAESQRQREELRAKRQKDLDDRLNTVFRTPEAPQLTEAERQQYQQSLPLIERMAEYHSHNALGGLRDTMRDVLSRNMELEDRLEEMQQTTKQNPRTQLDMMVRAQVPDVDTTLSDPQWAAFRDAVIPSLGVTPGQIIQNHYQSGNAQGVVNVLNTFKNRSKTTRTETPAPGMPSASAPSSRPAGRRMLRMSELNEAYARADQGLLSRDKLQGIVNKFEEAAAAGRVDYDK